jgi:PPK2 family polyphosphate:nucleotide phosphotransferase
MKAIHPEHFKVTGRFDLPLAHTTLKLNATDDELKDTLTEIGKQLGKLQDKMYANNRYSVLIVLQGMDTSGKDSLIKQVFKNFNARGVNVYSFKQPTALELRHDYLWRHAVALPERGKFTVFNRSHYENVLVSRVHHDYLLKENLPGIDKVEDIPADFWEMRFGQINNFEHHIAQNGTIVLKFFLNISKEEQRQRLLRRLELKDHNWKFSPADLDERELWHKYQKYYEDAINNTSTQYAPWYCIPADHKKTARLLVAKAILHELEKYDFHEPEVDEEVLENINAYKRKLESESGQ